MANRLPFGQYFRDTANDVEKIRERTLGKYNPEWKECKYMHYKLFGKFLPHLHFCYYAIVVDEEEKRIQIHIQKTSNDELTGFKKFYQSLFDWENNFMFVQKLYDTFYYGGDKIKLRVPKGWKKRWEAMEHPIRNDVEAFLNTHPNSCKDWTWEVIGWSQGSSGAILCTQTLAYWFNIEANCYTYGSVKPLYALTKKKRNKIINYFKDVCGEFYNFRDINDIVGKMPPFKSYFTINHCDVSLEEDKKTKLFRLFKATKYHTEYDLENYNDYEEHNFYDELDVEEKY